MKGKIIEPPRNGITLLYVNVVIDYDITKFINDEEYRFLLRKSLTDGKEQGEGVACYNEIVNKAFEAGHAFNEKTKYEKWLRKNFPKKKGAKSKKPLPRFVKPIRDTYINASDGDLPIGAPYVECWDYCEETGEDGFVSSSFSGRYSVAIPDADDIHEQEKLFISMIKKHLRDVIKEKMKEQNIKSYAQLGVKLGASESAIKKFMMSNSERDIQELEDDIKRLLGIDERIGTYICYFIDK